MTVVSPECVDVSDGDYFPATVAAKVSAESNFRELDDAFLQTQTRIWLGEVLHIRLDEETDISDILADGKLLSELSEVLSRMLPSLSIDATQSKMNEWKSFVSSKSTQRYMPYYNVGSFLKMCKNLGLDGIDLFSPSDVVEKRNTRKVCMCIRSLSKRARSRDLNVPDFDSVTCTLTMPTNMVECIRKSLEMSQSTSSLSDGLDLDRVPSGRFRTRISNSASTVSNEYSSEVCDDAESRLIVGEVNGPPDNIYDAESPKTSCSEVVGDYSPALHVTVRDLENEEDDQCEYLSPSNGESVGSPYSQYFSDQEIGVSFSDCIGSRVSGKVDSNNEAKPKYEVDDLLHTPFDLGDEHQNFGYHSDDHENIDESDCVSPDKQNTDTCIGSFEEPTHPSEIGYDKSTCEERREFFLEDGYTNGTPLSSLEDSGITRYELISEPIGDEMVKEDNLCNEVIVQRDFNVSGTMENFDFSCNGENHASLSCTDDIDDGEKFPYDSLNSSKSDPVNLPGEMSFLVEQSSSPDILECSSMLHVKLDDIDDPLISPRFADQIEVLGQLLHGNDTNVSKETNNSTDGYEIGDTDTCKKSSDSTEEHCDHDAMELLKVTKKCSENIQETHVIPEDHRPPDASNNGKVIDTADNPGLNSFTTNLDDTQPETDSPGRMEDTGHTLLQSVEDIEKEQGKTELINQESTTKDTPEPKPQRKLLKSVAKGTALLGIAVFLLHLRKSRQQNISRLTKLPVDVLKQNTSASSPKNAQKGGMTSSVYPAEKLNFGF